MRFSTCVLLFSLVCRTGSLFADGCDSYSGECACDGARGASILSMMVWGIGLGGGIALLCGLLEQDMAHAHN